MGLTETVERFLSTLSTMLTAQTVTVNGKGALIQVTNKGVALLMPAAALLVDSDQWSGPTLNSTDLEQSLMECFVPASDGGRVHLASILPPGAAKAVGKMRLGLLPPAAVRKHIPATLSYPVNTDLCML